MVSVHQGLTLEESDCALRVWSKEVESWEMRVWGEEVSNVQAVLRA